MAESLDLSAEEGLAGTDLQERHNQDIRTMSKRLMMMMGLLE
jgi:hypothetical protein